MHVSTSVDNSTQLFHIHRLLQRHFYVIDSMESILYTNGASVKLFTYYMLYYIF